MMLTELVKGETTNNTCQTSYSLELSNIFVESALAKQIVQEVIITNSKNNINLSTLHF